MDRSNNSAMFVMAAPPRGTSAVANDGWPNSPIGGQFGAFLPENPL